MRLSKFGDLKSERTPNEIRLATRHNTSIPFVIFNLDIDLPSTLFSQKWKKSPSQRAGVLSTHA